MDTNLSPLLDFKKQFTFMPKVVNERASQEYSSVVICGMGGSAIVVSLLKSMFPEFPITLHNTYGLPSVFDKEKTLFILNSYSGNTEEVLDSLERLKKEHCELASLSKGGSLHDESNKLKIPYVTIPESDLEPRFSIGYQILGILALLGEKEKISTVKRSVDQLNVEKAQVRGNDLAIACKDTYPILYASSNLYPVAYLIKAAINEGAKVPSFVNQIPEANHNELQSFVTDENTSEKNNFSFIIMESTFDHVRILKRFSVMNDLYTKKGFVTKKIEGDHTSISSLFEIVLTGYFMATYMAQQKHIDPYKTPFIALFKEKMKEE
jgi:bifunctional phosphoglucose/phosphomannose isomerase